MSEGNLTVAPANYAGEYGGYLYDLGGQDGVCRLEEFASGRGMVRWARSLFEQYRIPYCGRPTGGCTFPNENF